MGTDDKQLFTQGGFALGFTEDLLVPALPAFGSRELAEAGPVVLMRLEDGVVIQAGPWAIDLHIDRAGRYLDTTSVLPRGPRLARLTLDPDDRAALLAVLNGPCPTRTTWSVSTWTAQAKGVNAECRATNSYQLSSLVGAAEARAT